LIYNLKHILTLPSKLIAPLLGFRFHEIAALGKRKFI